MSEWKEPNVDMGKTITTYLITGDPKRPQYVLISNKLCKMIICPRSNLSIINEREELKTPSFYVLLGESEDAKPKAYIGETEDFSARVKNHDYKKDFWNKALIFVSIGGAMTKADVEYLEYKGIDVAMEEKRYILEKELWNFCCQFTSGCISSRVLLPSCGRYSLHKKEIIDILRYR